MHVKEQELSGLELRKALCEALGWREAKSGWWHSPMCVAPAEDLKNCNYGRHVESINYIPALESDPGAFWPEFLKQCRERKWSYKIHGGSPFIDDEFTIYDDAKRLAHGGSKDILEAGARAWLKALKVTASKESRGLERE